VSAVELAFAGALGLGGVRSLLVWIGRPLDSSDPGDQALYAVYVAARAGLWFAFAGFFAGYALVDDPLRFRWYVLVPICISAVHLLAGFALGNRSSN